MLAVGPLAGGGHANLKIRKSRFLKSAQKQRHLNEKSKERFSSRAFVSSTLASARIRSSSVLYLRLTAPPTPDRRFEPAAAASCGLGARAGAGAGSGFEANDAGVNDLAY